MRVLDFKIFKGWMVCVSNFTCRGVSKTRKRNVSASSTDAVE